MRLFFSFIFLLNSCILSAQGIALHWQTNLGGTNNEYGYSTIATSDGGYIMVGSTQSNKDGDVPQSRGFVGINGNDFWIVKVNYFGIIQWSKAYGGSKDDIATAVVETKDKGFLVLGTSNSTDGEAFGNGNGSRGGLLLLKLKTDGTLEWKKVFSGGYNLGETDFQKADGNVKPALRLNPDGSIMVSASREEGFPSSGTDFWLTKLDATGKDLWSSKYGGNQDDFVNDLIVCSDGGFLIVGSTASSSTAIEGAGKGFMDIYIVKTNANGKLLWQKGFGGTNYDAAFSVIENTDKSYFIVGETNSTDGDMVSGLGLKDGFVIKLGEDGKLHWRNQYGGSNNDGFYSIQKTEEGKLMVFGYSASKIGDIKPKSSAADAWMMRLETNGNLISNAFFGGADFDIARNGFLAPDGSFIVVGNSNSVDGDVEDNNGQADFWVFKSGNPLPVSMKTFSLAATPEQFVKLTWETINETKSKSFGIDKSSDDKNFTELTRVLAAGNSTLKKNYEFIDKKPTFGKSYYRLKYYDESGKEFLFKTIAISLSATANEPMSALENYEVFPNPVENNQFFLKNTSFLTKNLHFLSIDGKPIAIETNQEKSDLISVRIPNHISSGSYFLLIENNGKTFVKKIMVK